MAERALFLDRDNTIIANDGYLGDPSKVVLLQGAATAIAAMRRLGFRIIVASNQSGVARGMFDEAAVEAVNQEMCKQLREQAGALIDASYYCPYHPEAVVPEYKMEHEWRKPKPGMLKQAAEDFGLDLAQCWMIGDMPRDIASGAAAGCRTILLRDPDHPAPSNESDSLSVSPNFIVKTLADAARIVAREGRTPVRDSVRDLVPAPVPVTPITPAVAEAMAPAATVPASEPAARPASVTVALDHAALAEKIAAAIAPALAKASGNSDALRPIMEEIATQLRHANRAHDIPEFSLLRLLAGLLQFLVPVLLILGAWVGYSAYAPPSDPSLVWVVRTSTLMTANLWMIGAVALQGIVIALNQMARHR